MTAKAVDVEADGTYKTELATRPCKVTARSTAIDRDPALETNVKAITVTEGDDTVPIELKADPRRPLGIPLAMGPPPLRAASPPDVDLPTPRAGANSSPMVFSHKTDRRVEVRRTEWQTRGLGSPSRRFDPAGGGSPFSLPSSPVRPRADDPRS